MNDSVLVERNGAVTLVTLNRPDRLNAFSTDMTTRLSAAFEAAERDKSCRAILVTGAGRGFCAGQDLSERAVAPGKSERADVGHSIETRFNPLIRRMRACPKPIVVAVNGVAAGAGANFALAGDIVLAAKSASFIQSFVKIGLMPDCGGTWFLPHHLGPARAMALALTAEPLPAEKAAEWGLIWKAVDDAELAGQALALAQKLAQQSPSALAAIKQAVHAAASRSLDAALDHERDAQRELGYGDDFAEGVAAFLEKRAPKFS
ncbi:MAG: 2-(1,2-epoxy-1,2-dihydrophenyl)acetyl-CoA isomerase [Pseudomonadota bacterium]|nr:2-(1,2-epoxy-1,2-dihydrophenyl)acetyl-CoA isomerase [Pseudomonadota bacterium]